MRIDEFSLEAGICQWDKKMIKIRYLIWSNINFAWNCEFQGPLRVAHPKKMRCLSGLCEGTNEIQANCSRACFKLKCIRYSFRDKLPFFIVKEQRLITWLLLGRITVPTIVVQDKWRCQATCRIKSTFVT